MRAHVHIHTQLRTQPPKHTHAHNTRERIQTSNNKHRNASPHARTPARVPPPAACRPAPLLSRSASAPTRTYAHARTRAGAHMPILACSNRPRTYYNFLRLRRFLREDGLLLGRVVSWSSGPSMNICHYPLAYGRDSH